MTPLSPAGRHAEWRPAPVELVVSDLDGTFLADSPSAAVREATAALVGSGVRFAFATGRHPAGIPDLGGLVTGPNIVHNGAQVLGGQASALDAVFPLSTTEALGLAEVCRRYDVYGEFYAAEGNYVTRPVPYAQGAWEEMMGAPLGFATDDVIAGTTIIKATVVDYTGEHVLDIARDLLAIGLAAEESTAPAMPDAVFINATARAVSKGATLRWLCERLGIPLEAVVAIGDGRNDSSMFQIVGTAIAMGSAPADVVALAHFVAPDVFDDGAAVAMRAVLASDVGRDAA